MILRSFQRAAKALLLWTAKLTPVAAVGPLLFAVDGGLKWLALFGRPLLLLALRGNSLGCGPRGCGVGGEKVHGHSPAPLFTDLRHRPWPRAHTPGSDAP